MNEGQKREQLRKHKMLATGLFLIMAALFIGMSIAIKQSAQPWMYYVKAFSEAAMVGALADWFAVTALFHYPLGLRIPHTNLIENSKQKIGDNLGSFVVDNFLTAENLRPYIVQLNVARYASDWLSKDKNQALLLHEGSGYLRKVINDLDDSFVIDLMGKQGGALINEFDLNSLLGQGIQYAIDKEAHQPLITFIAGKLQLYISQNEELVKEKVKQESSALIPGFVDNIIARRLTNGLSRFFEEIAADEHHPLRAQLSEQLILIGQRIQEREIWVDELQQAKVAFLESGQLASIANDIWSNIKRSLLEGLAADNSAIKNYLARMISSAASSLREDAAVADNINKWIRKNAYAAVMRNRNSLGTLISKTVGEWEGKALSEKLELEVGKDLQFIRINGTLVGGVVGLIIYALSELVF